MRLTDVLLWIEASAPARFLAENSTAYPAVSTLHLFGIALVFGSIVPVDLRMLNALGPQFDAVLPSLIRTALIGFAIAAPSGMLLASVRIVDYAQNPAFLIKMAVLLAAGANALSLRFLAGSRDIRGLVGRPRGRTAATVSLSLWIAAISAGRWIAFV